MTIAVYWDVKQQNKEIVQKFFKKLFKFYLDLHFMRYQSENKDIYFYTQQFDILNLY